MIRLLHGALGEASDWEAFQALLEPHPSRAVELLAEPPGSYAEFAAGLNAQATGGDVLIGYSMGGRLALHALLEPDAPWQAAVIISAHSGLSDAEERQRRLQSDQQWAELARSDWQAFLKQWSALPVFGGADIPWQRRSSEAMATSVAASFDHWSLGRQRDLLPELPEIRCPVLWITGERDEKFCAIGEQAVAQISDGQLATIPHAGHRVPWEQAEKCAEVIQGFLSRRIV